MKSITIPTGWKGPSGGGGGGAVDSVDGRTGVVTLGDKYVDLTGGTMTGDLTVPRLNLGDVDTGLVRSAAGVVSGFTALALGLTPSTTGAIRLTSTQSISTRNGANTADVVLIRNSATGVIVGGTNATGVFLGEAAIPVVLPGTLAIGTNPATTGAIRLPNNQRVYGRNAANTADAFLLGYTTADQLVVGGFSATLAVGVAVNALNNTIFALGDVQQAALAPNILTFKDDYSIVVGSTVGLKIGSATTQKLGFWGATPVAQPANTVAIDDLLVSIGLRAAGGVAKFAASIAVGSNSALGGAIRIANNTDIRARNVGNTADITMLTVDTSDNTVVSATNTKGVHVVVGATTLVQFRNGNVGLQSGVNLSFGGAVGGQVGIATSEKLAFWGATPVIQPTGTPAAATDPATTMALVNDLRTKLMTIGLMA